MKFAQALFGALFCCLIGASAMAQGLVPNARQTFTDANGAPLVGGSVQFYVPSTTTPKTTWGDATETTPNTNPVILDALGSASIYGNGSYRQVVKDVLGNLIWDSQTTALYNGLSGPLVQSFTGSVPSLVSGNALVMASTINGGLFGGLGATNDACLVNSTGTPGACVPHGTTGLSVAGTLTSPAAVLTGTISAPITADGSILQVASNSSESASQIYGWAISTTSALIPAWDAIRGVAVNPSGTTVPYTLSGVAGYIVNETASVANKSQAIGVFGVSVCSANGSFCWGMDSLTSDNKGLFVNASTGKTIVGAEHDLNITSPNTTAFGVMVGGTALAQPAGANGVSVNTLWDSTNAPTVNSKVFSNAFISQNGSAAVGLNLGAAKYAGTNINSQPLFFNYFDSSAANQEISLAAVGNTLYVEGTNATNNFRIQQGGLQFGTAAPSFSIPCALYQNSDNFGVFQGCTAGFRITNFSNTVNNMLLTDAGNLSIAGSAELGTSLTVGTSTTLNGALNLASGTRWVAVTNCGSLASSTKCVAIGDPNGNTMYVPAYGTY